jgi:citrate lyase subunit beta / citryl-CoA lyase
MASSTYLFVPANRPDRVEKAIASGADEVIVDLEDAVGQSDKEAARAHLASLVPSRSLCVRINDESTPYFGDDLAAVASLPWVSAVVVPKVIDAAQVQRVLKCLRPGAEVLALIESARSIRDIDGIAESGAARLLFGIVDYASDLAATPSDELYGYARARLVVASAAAGLPAPVDGPTLEVGDDEKLRRDAELSCSLGMGGKLCIHPRQVPVVGFAFARDTDSLEWARAVLDGYTANGGNAFLLDGQMIDAPVVTRARGVISRQSVSN